MQIKFIPFFISSFCLLIQLSFAQNFDADGNIIDEHNFLKTSKPTVDDSTYTYLNIPEGFVTHPGQLSKDGLEYYISLWSDEGTYMYVYTRISIQDTFATPTLLPGTINSKNLGVYHPTITENKLTLVYVRNPDNLWLSNELYISTRETTSAPFDSGRALDEINQPTTAEAYPYITADGLNLYFTRGTNTNYKLWKAERITTADTFLTAVAIDIDAPAKARSCWLSADEQEIYFTHADSASFLYKSFGTTVEDSFSTPEQLDVFGFGQVTGPSLVSDQLFLHSSPKGNVDKILIFDSIPEIVVSIAEVDKPVLLPGYFSLDQNYPNPFNPSTSISYSLTKGGFVSLDIYDIVGRKIATLVNQKQTANTYNIHFFADNLNSGIYFYTLKVNYHMVDTKKMIYLK